ncbi:MAG: preprotein translocase subunit SecA [Candidatus Latescibacteria bacterium]|nr:preprotein translocase subunit SecA [Candidatus Latescibacterota bacterium]
MIGKWIANIFGTKHDRDVKQMAPLVEEINEWAKKFQDLTDEQCAEKTREFQVRIEDAREEVRKEMADSEDPAETKKAVYEVEQDALDDILPEAFGLVKDTCRRMVGKSWPVREHEKTWIEIPYDVQLMGGIVLHEGKIAEMATGEGKTLVAILPLYLNALTGRGAHLVTVNEYLANRDREWMGPVFEFLGLTVDCLQLNEMVLENKQKAYQADITYGTTHEFGFDYLRDNMKVRLEDRVQRDWAFAIVDEVDSILIDEARTPLIISGEVKESNSERYSLSLPDVQKLVKAQTRLASKLIAEAEVLLEDEEGDDYEAGVKMLRAQRGSPKNKKLLKLQQESGVKKLIQQVEADYIRDKRMSELDDELYFTVEEKSRQSEINEQGRELLSPGEQEMFVIPDLGEEMHLIESDESLTVEEINERKSEMETLYAERSEKIHNMQQLLQAFSIFEKDVDYVVEEGKVVLVDQFTGRLMYGRRYSEGLHQAIEAKEGVKIEQETRTVATITIQNYFRMYDKLAGMTGTAETEAGEFFSIYKLDVVVIPTNQAVRRMDYEDVIFRTRSEKYNSVLDEIAEKNKNGQPILVGTTSVESSETFSRLLKRRGIPHNVLNAKYHQHEAEIVSNAGEPGALTIATNLAGRGTDIKLGDGVIKCEQCHLHSKEPMDTPTADGLTLQDCYDDTPCGLHIVGTERHESRRIDRQLRGRSGRQGDPGSTRFYLSLEDDLMRLFGSERIASVMDRLKIPEGEVIEHSMVSNSIGRAQKRVEGQNFDIRKHLLEYDDVMNQQREAVYDRRLNALEGNELRSDILEMIRNIVELKVATYTDPKTYPEDWDLQGLYDDLLRNFVVVFRNTDDDLANLTTDALTEMVHDTLIEHYERKEASLIPSPDLMRQLERFATLSVIDNAWQEHLYEIDRMKEGIHLRAYAQKDPLIEYKREAFAMFEELWDRLDEEILKLIFSAELTAVEPQKRQEPSNLRMIHQEAGGMEAAAASPGGEEPTGAAEEDGQPKQQPVKVDKKVGRNDPCPCGSGKKYKKCHGAGTD